MRKIISRIFVRIIAISLALLSFNKDVFAKSQELIFTKGDIPFETPSSLVI